MTRSPRFIAGLALVLCCGALYAQPPNIVFIVTDDLGYGDLGSYGHPVIQTPNLDALAASGARFTRFYAPSALCSPSRAAMLTGRHPYRTGIQSWIPEDSGIFLKQEEITLAEMLKEAGYNTALVGKWHLNADLGSPDEPQPTDQGFDYFYGHNAFQIPTNRNPTNLYRNKSPLGTQKGYTAALFADEALQWLEAQNNKTPFFLMLSMAEPHTTIENPPQHNARYADFTQGKVIPIPSGLPEPPKKLLTPRGPGEYYANITYMDEQLGRVLDKINEPAMRSNTVVVFVSDNGPVTSDWINWWEVNAYGSTGGFRGRKHTLYEGGLLVPALLRAPGVTEPGQELATPLIGTDLFTTLLAIAGLTPPSDRPIDGRNLLPLFTGGTLGTPEFLWALPVAIPYAWRSGDWKLLLNAQQEAIGLYHLATDPLEQFNLMDGEVSRVKSMVTRFKQQLAAIEADE